MSAAEHRQTLGMPDVLDEYPVPGPRSMDGVLGFEVTELGDAEVRGRAPVTDSVRQRFGLVHGGTYAALAEMVATEGTVVGVWKDGNAAMGLSNATNFMRPITDGTIHAVARRIHAGRTTWIWDVDLSDDQGRVCAVSRVTVAVRRRAAG
ncbi:MAG TPA: PaaI family thioesterase [Solirubrobacteraceae bacterium]